MKFSYTAVEIPQILRRKRHLVACILSAIVGFLTFQFIPGYFKNNSTILVLDLSVSSGTRLEVYVNQNFSEPLVEELVPGQRTQYRLKGLVEDIRSLRIDPGESPGAAIDLYGVWTEDKDGSFSKSPSGDFM